MRNVRLLLFFVVAALIILPIALFTSFDAANPVPDEELQTRVAESAPAWDGYQEDIKAQIGATPVAQWRGEPRKVEREGNTLRVTFRVAGPWAEGSAAMPILLQDPYGATYQNATAEVRGGGEIEYSFELAGSATQTLPWVKVRYPHHEKRLPLSQEGTWEAAE